MLKTCELRVYQPGESGSRPVVGAGPPPLAGSATSHVLLGERPSSAVMATEWQGSAYSCPRHTLLRMWEGLVAGHMAYRGAAGTSLIPEAVAASARRSLDSLHRRDPTARSHILTSSWYVPIRWFIPFSGDDRRLSGSGDALTIVYRRDVGSGLDRLRRALGIIRATDLPGHVVQEIEELLDWAEGFADDHLLELDYGRVASMFDRFDLAVDESASDVWDSLEALGREDWEEAGRAYTRLMDRWGHAMSIPGSN